ncbi:hypothetical protein RHECNPAF_2330095 [Rhizobium etli CNPAF512]|nr:hypothetical protein RHECNPAF_2330095 [Rhizobium etli CNPAF512]
MTRPMRFSSGLSSSRGRRPAEMISIAAVISVIHPGVALLEPAQAHDRDQADDEEEDADERHRFDVAIVAVGDALGLVHQLEHGDCRKQRRLLEHGDEVVGERRDHRRDGLRQDHVDPGLARRQIGGPGCLPLPAWHILDAGAIDLGGIGRIVNAHADDAGSERRQPDADIRQHVEDEVELHQQRRTADEFRDEADRPGNGGDRGPSRNRQTEANDHGDRSAEDGGENGDLEPFEKGRHDLPDEIPIPFHPIRSLCRRHRAPSAAPAGASPPKSPGP